VNIENIMNSAKKRV